jgi:molybdopterin converting factor small subunit
MRVVTILLFARARDMAGADVVELTVPPAATVADVRHALAAAHPNLAGLAVRSAVAVNNDYAGDDVQIPLHAEIALVPPVSGG